MYPFNVYTVAETPAPVLARNRLSINPAYTIHDCPPPDIIVIPGGYGARQAMENPALVDWVRTQAARVELTLSVCTGALILGRAGVLDGLAATTYHSDFDELAEAAPNTELRPGERWVDNGAVVTSAGVSAGIDAALHVVGKLFGEAQAARTARAMEYEYWPPQS
jgi:transcriptional regulator GlxA family with amidase domain